MRPIQAALLLGVLAGLALVVWLVAGLGQEQPKVAGPTPFEDLVRADSGARTGPEGALEPGPGVGAEDADVPDTERSAVAADAGPKTAESLALRGRVVDELGQPVARARVYAGPAGESPGIALDLADPEVMSWVRRVETTSTADGTFELQGAPGGSVSLAVRAPGFAPLRTQREPDAAGRDLGDLVLERGVVIAGRVVDEAGRAVPGAEVHALPVDAPGLAFAVLGSPGTLLATTEEAGRFEIDEMSVGPYRLRVSHPDHPDAVVSGETSQPGELSSGVLVRLEQGFEIAGMVLDLEARAGADLSVRAQAIEPDATFLGLKGGTRRAAVEPDGAFLLRGLRGEREYTLRVVENDGSGPFGTERSEAVAARPGDRGVQLRLQKLVSVFGQVVEAEGGAPIASFVVEAGSAWLKAQQEEGEPVEQHAEGRFRYEGVELYGASDTISVRIRAEGFETWSASELAVPPGRELDLGRIPLAAVPRIAIHVRAADTEAPVPGARVSLREERPEAGGRDFAMPLGAPGEAQVNTATSDASGTALVASLPGRSARVKVSHKNFAPFESDPLPLPATGGMEYQVRLLRGGAVEVLVLTAEGLPAPGVGVQHLAPAEHGTPGWRLPQVSRSDAQGRLVFDHLTPGAHAFRLAEEDHGASSWGVRFRLADEPQKLSSEWVELVVIDGARDEVVLRLAPRGALRGSVQEAGRPLPGATVLLRRSDPAEGETAPRFFGTGGGPQAKTDARGAYELADVQVGDYRLFVTHPARAMDERREVRIVEGENELDVELALSVVEGRVTDEDGQPVEGARVRARRAQGDEQPNSTFGLRPIGGGDLFLVGEAGGGAALTDADGRYQLRGVHPEVPLIVEVQAEDSQPASSEEVRVERNQVRSGVDVELVFGGRVEVEVLAPDGSPASFCLVTASFVGESQEPVEDQREFIQEGGKASFRGLVPGAWRFHVRSLSFGRDAGSEPQVEPRQVTVVPKETRALRLELR